MASVWVKRRVRKSGTVRFEVSFRLGGREAAPRYAGSFRTLREARQRRDWIAGELAAHRVPHVALIEHATVTFAQAAERWRQSRRDVAQGTAHTYEVALRRLLPLIGERPLQEITAVVVNEVVETLSAKLKRESLRKTLSVAAMVLDHEAIEPNPVRSPLVKLPRGEKRTSTRRPPSTSSPSTGSCPRYRLPLVVLEATGMRVGELEELTWGDVDEPSGRWRVAAGRRSGHAVGDTAARCVRRRCSAPSPAERLAPASGGCSRASGRRFRTAIARACGRRACRRSRRTTSGIGASACCTPPGCRGPGSASWSATATS